MPSIGTEVLSARVKHETYTFFKELAKEYNTTVPNILDALAGVTSDPALEAFFVEEDSFDGKDTFAYAIELTGELLEAGVPEEDIRAGFDFIRGELL